MNRLTSSFFLTLAIAFWASCAAAHVSLAEPQAAAGAPYRAVLRIGHGCDAAPTTAVTVTPPAGFSRARGLPRPGWDLSSQAGAITWTASAKNTALPDGERGEFVLDGALPATPGVLWFKVLQSCGQAALDWSQVPAGGLSTAGLKTPAAALEVLSPADFAQFQRRPKVEGAWMRSAVAGQSGSGVYMRLTAREPMQLVGVTAPVAGSAGVHEMKMDGDVMRMRAIDKLDLPAGKAVELKPGGFHVMLMDLKRPLAPDSSVPLTLLLRDAKGVASKLDIVVPVRVNAPGGGEPAAAAHKH